MNEEKALKIVWELRKNGYQAFFVGGWVRDMLLGKKTSDVDICTNATPDRVYQIFRGTAKVELVGKSFGVALVGGVEVATFRKDKYFGLSDKNVEVSPGTLEEDCERRDFTVNSMYYDPFTKEIIDFVGGQRDLQTRTIRFIGEPRNRIFEDPNRIVRACRFLALLDGHFEESTFEALKNYSSLVGKYVAPERLRVEVLKAMKARKPSKFFRALHDIGALKYVFPSLEECFGLEGGRFHVETVFDHSLRCGDNISCKFPLVRLAGFLHDVGKPKEIKLDENGEVCFRCHEVTGSEIVASELRRLKFPNHEIRFVSGLVSLHMRATQKMGDKGVRRLLRECSERGLSWKDLVRIWFADHKRGSHPFGFKKALVSLFWRELKQRPKGVSLEVDGHDVLRLLSVKPGPLVGRVLRTLLNEVLEDPSKNNRDYLLTRIVQGSWEA